METGHPVNHKQWMIISKARRGGRETKMSDDEGCLGRIRIDGGYKKLWFLLGNADEF